MPELQSGTCPACGAKKSLTIRFPVFETRQITQHGRVSRWRGTLDDATYLRDIVECSSCEAKWTVASIKEDGTLVLEEGDADA